MRGINEQFEELFISDKIEDLYKAFDKNFSRILNIAPVDETDFDLFDEIPEPDIPEETEAERLARIEEES